MTQTIKLASLAIFAASGLATAAEAWTEGAVLQPPAAPAPAPVAAPASEKASYMCTDAKPQDDTKIGWDGFLNGLRGFEHFYEPIGNPIYFESPFNTTGVRFLYLYHGFPGDSQLQGGQVNVAAMQARVALTERLAFIAVKDGYSWLDTGIGISDDGWNDIAAGLKYTFIADKEHDLLMAGGVRYMANWTGEAKVLQGNVDEFSPFISVAKGFDRFHLIGDFTYRLPVDSNDGNSIIQWDVHSDFDVGHGFAPFLELHGLHYMTNGQHLDLEVGGLDYSNFGSMHVSGSTVIWFSVGGRIKFTQHVSTGAAFEYPLTNRDADIFGERVTVDFMLTW